MSNTKLKTYSRPKAMHPTTNVPNQCRDDCTQQLDCSVVNLIHWLESALIFVATSLIPDNVSCKLRGLLLKGLGQQQ